MSCIGSINDRLESFTVITQIQYLMEDIVIFPTLITFSSKSIKPNFVSFFISNIILQLKHIGTQNVIADSKKHADYRDKMYF